MTIGVTPTGRLLQANTNVTDAIALAYAASLANILQNMANNMGYDEPNTYADSKGVYNYSDILATALTDGLPPPSEATLTQLGAWILTLGPDVRISQMSSIVLRYSGKTVVVGPQDASTIAGSLLLSSNSPVSGSSTSGSNTVAIAASISTLAILGIASALFFVRRRKTAVKQIPLSKSKVIKEYTGVDILNGQRNGQRNVWAPTSTSGDVSSLATRWKKEQSYRTVKVADEANMVKHTTDKVQAFNTLQYLQHYKSKPNLLVLSNNNTTKTIEDENGRKGFITNIARKMPEREKEESQESQESQDKGAGVMPIRHIASVYLDSIKKSSRNTIEHKKKKSSRRTLPPVEAKEVKEVKEDATDIKEDKGVKDEVKEEAKEEEVVEVKKKPRHSAKPVEVEETPQKKKKRHSKRSIDAVMPETEETKDAVKPEEPILKKSKSKKSTEN